MQKIDSWEEYFMRMAYLVAMRSKDTRTKIGSVLVRDNIVISTGYNGFSRGVKDLPERYEDRDLKRKIVNHSEENTILQCARLGISSDNSTLITPGIPCHSCARILIQGGVKEIVIHSQWPNLTHSSWTESTKLAEELLNEVGIKIRVFGKILNVVGFLDGKEIMV